MTTNNALPIYEMSINVRIAWQAHSLSNAGSDGSIRTLPRRQLLADGVEVDACSGNIAKHYHAVLTAEYLESLGGSLCPACAERDGRRAAALYGLPGYEDMDMERVLRECGLCDTHGFLLPAKKASGDDPARPRLSKHSLVEFSFALALPEHQAETVQLTTRSGDGKEEGQMWMKKPARSGEYALCIRYKSVGIGVDTDKWNVVVEDEGERLRRHRAILSALRDQLTSPSGAMTSTSLPHLTGMMGAIAVRCEAGRAPVYSALDQTFVARLTAMADTACQVFPFETVDQFSNLMNRLIETSNPRLPGLRTPQTAGLSKGIQISEKAVE